jgi:pimeloyl-ACP methyl ester carboxylesterase
MNTITLNGTRINYLSAGSESAAAPLMLLHGGGIDSASLSWGGVIEPLAAVRRVLAPDLPGYGESDRPDAPYSIAYYRTIVEQFADTLGLQRFDLGGLSMGGGIALAYTLAHPERVRRLVLVDTYGIQPDYPPQFLSYLFVRTPQSVMDLAYRFVRNRPGARATLRSFVRTPEALTDELLDAVIAEVRRPHAGRAFNVLQRHEVLRDRLLTDFMPELGKIAAPVMIVHGGADTLVPLKYAQEACRRIAACRLEVLPGAGHWAQRERPADFVRLVNEFLA